MSKVDSNLTGLRYAVEATLGALPGSGVVWYPLEPNSYGDFGSNVTTTARAPINAGRQRRKGVVTDLDASASFQVDLVREDLKRQLPGFFFAAWRDKVELAATAAVDNGVAADGYTVASGGALAAGTLIWVTGSAITANNGLKVVAAGSTATEVKVPTGSLTATTEALTIKVVGYQGGPADLTLTNSGGVKTLGSTLLNFTTLGLIPGEWVFVGGDAAGTQFATAANNGFARVKTVAAHAVTFDKTQGTWVTDAGTGKTIRLFVGDVVKNESDPGLIVRQTVQLERTLSTAGIEYLVGCVANTLTVNMSTADKVTLDLGYVAIDHATVAYGAEKAGTRPTIGTGEAFNTSSDFSRLRLADDGTDALLASYLTEATISISNNANPTKGLGVLGAFDVSVGDFTAGGNLTAYFSTITAVEAVRSNADATLDFVLVKNNAGMLVDLPLLSLSNGRLQVEKDQPIKIPLATEAAEHPVLHHTLLVTNFEYLPDLAE
jgi:hypothetical protein